MQENPITKKEEKQPEIMKKKSDKRSECKKDLRSIICLENFSKKCDEAISSNDEIKIKCMIGECETELKKLESNQVAIYYYLGNLYAALKSDYKINTINAINGYREAKKDLQYPTTQN